MSNTNHTRQGIANIPNICYRLGVREVILCPGSRNAPLIVSFTQFGNINCISITDERSAAYFALGIVQYTRRPVAVVCTSGTAALNLAPAIAEAYYQNLPLIVFTADRPVEWVDQADGQVIRQQNIFANYIKSAYNLPLETVHNDDLWFSNRLVAQAISYAVQCPAGPVQINVPLREPLYNLLPKPCDDLKVAINIAVDATIPTNELDILRNKWGKCEKVLIIVGIHEPDIELNNIVNVLSELSNVVVLAENLSNISGNNIIDSTESFIASLSDHEKGLFKPNLLVTVGHSLVSKRLKQYLRVFKPDEHWHIGVEHGFVDTFNCLSHVLSVNSVWMLKQFVGFRNTCESQYAQYAMKKFEKVIHFRNHYLEHMPFSDIAVFNTLMNIIPENTLLHLANSTPVRLAQLFTSRRDIAYFANRGTSGIDGCVSTAAGAAFASQKSCIVITGDISFIYDSNALWNNHISDNFKVIVINNGGGNIFRLIDSTPEIDNISYFFETPHKVKIQLLAEAFGFQFLTCNNMSQLHKMFNTFLQMNKLAVLEIQTDAEVNTATFKDFYNQIIKNT